MFNWFGKKKKPKVDDGYQAKLESLAAKEKVVRKILGEERRRESVPFNGHDRRLRTV